MNEYDFFALTGISLTEKSASKIDTLITKKITDLNEKRNSESQDTKRHELEAQIKFLKDSRINFINSGRLTQSFHDMVKAKTEELKRRLTSIVLLEKNSRKNHELVITAGKIRHLRNNSEHGTALSLKEIEQVYIDNGFRIENASTSSSMPKIPDRCGSIHRDIIMLRDRVQNDRKINPQRLDSEFVHDLYTFTAYITGDTENYNDYRDYSTSQLKSKLEPYLTKYAGYSSDTIEKLEANIAGQAVSFIFDSDEHRKGYDNYLLMISPKLAELFENMNGLLESDLRDPDIAEMCINTIAEVFGDYDTALAVYNSRPELRNDPYMPERPVFIVRCAHCQELCEFRTVNDAKNINKCTNCGEALYKTCPKCGKSVLFSLSVCPDCSYSFPDPERFKKLMRRFEAAHDKHEKLNISLDILNGISPDFTPAKEFLALTPPEAPSSLTLSPNDNDTSILLSWPLTGEREVNYLVVRKEGNNPPVSFNDGVIIMPASDKLSFIDRDIKPAVIYSYSLFAVRRGVYSEPVSSSSEVISTVSDIHHDQRGNVIYLTWKRPENCINVEVSCSFEGVERVISSGALNSLTFPEAELNKCYTFYFTAEYDNNRYSRKVRFDVIPSPEIQDFKIDCRQIRENIYEISWDIKESNIDIQILSGSDVLQRTRSEMRTCRIILSKDQYHIIRASASSGGKIIYSLNEIKINTYSAIELNDSRTRIIEDKGRVNISLVPSGKIPDDIKGFIYFLRVNETWPNETDNDSNYIDSSSFRSKGSIEISFIAGDEDKYYLSLYAVYNSNGNDIFSQPCRKVIKRPVTANIFWKVTKPLFRGYRLTTRTEADILLTRRPRLLLCCSKNGSPVLSPDDSNSKVILEVPELNYNQPLNVLNEVFDIRSAVKRGNDLYLFVKSEGPDEKFILRWDNGFNGKS